MIIMFTLIINPCFGKTLISFIRCNIYPLIKGMVREGLVEPAAIAVDAKTMTGIPATRDLKDMLVSPLLYIEVRRERRVSTMGIS